jgi:hypothetical protein
MAATLVVWLVILASFSLAQTPVVEYVDRSADVGFSYSGQPRNAMNVNYDNDAYKDFVITRFTGNGDALGYEGTGIATSGAPQFSEKTNDIFPSSIEPSAGTTGLVTGDFDNDGYIDIFACDVDGGAKLYKNDGGDNYVDWTAASDLDSFLSPNHEDVYSASWADYDGDGYLDLTVVSGTPYDLWGTLQVIHNDAGTFDGVAISQTYRVGHSPLWADFDADGDLDLVVLKTEPDVLNTPPPNYANYFYVNQGDGTFVEDGFDRLGYVSTISGGTIATVADLENDGDLDIVFALEEGDVDWLENDGTGYFTLRSLATVTPANLNPTDIAVFDFDLDGYQDVLVGYGSPYQVYGTSSIHLIANRDGGGGTRTFIEETSATGLGGSAFFAGLAPADYNGDGFTDLYLTRLSNQAYFYKAQTASGQSQNNWLGIHLDSPYGANNTGGIGAVVTVEAGASSYFQIVDGGSGFASQHEADLVFGLGNHTGTVDIEIVWPAGRTQTVTGVTTGQYVTVVDDSPVIDLATVTTDKTYHAGTTDVDWYFIWETYNDCPITRDKITFDLSSVPASCHPPYSVLTSQTPGVTITKLFLGGGKWEHTLKLAGVECAAKCAIPFVAESGVVDYTTTSAAYNAKMSINYCLQSQ